MEIGTWIAQEKAPLLQDVLNFFSNYNVANRAFELPEPAIVASRRILVMTCGAAGILRCGDYGQYHKTCKAKANPDFLAGLEFSHVLMDEAGQASSPLHQCKYLRIMKIFMPLRASGITLNHASRSRHFLSLILTPVVKLLLILRKDEHSGIMQALAPEALAPLMLLNPIQGKALLCGDPK